MEIWHMLKVEFSISCNRTFI